VNTMASYEKYLREHPGGRFMGEALERFRAFEKLEEEAQWKRADEASSASGYLQYLERYPYGANAGVAKLRLSGLGAVPPAIVWTNSLDMKFSWVPAGTFLMGSTDAQVEEALKECRRYSSECKRIWFEEEQPPRLVTIARGFWMGRYEVTQGQYKAVMGTNPSLFKTCGKDCPVERVSWNDAKEFISKLNDPQRRIRLLASLRSGMGIRGTCRDDDSLRLRRFTQVDTGELQRELSIRQRPDGTLS